MGVKRYMLTLLLSLFTLVNIWAQKREISGVVKEPSGQGAIAATVQVKGTTIGTVTDNNGNYTISVPADAKILVFKYYGMQDEEVPIKGNKIDVLFREDTKILDDVVVIGYGTSNRRDLTGPIASVDPKKLQDVPVASAAELLSGKLAGVQVTTTEGAPDAEVNIRVRGGGSITQSNEPLYIVDGIPVASISDISPTEIQSIDVLKDASSTAIYGSRGANGVIIVTTKDTKEDGKLTVNYNGSIGYKWLTKSLDILSTQDFILYQYERALIKGGTTVKDEFDKYFGSTINDGFAAVMESHKDDPTTNWQEKIFGNTGFNSNQSISLAGGNKTTSFNVTYNRIDDKAIMLGSDYVRDNLSLKIAAKPTKKIKLNFNARYTDTQVTGSGGNDVNSIEKSTSDSRLKHTVIYTPTPIQDLTAADPTDEEEVGSLYPPDLVIAENYKFKRTTRYTYNGSVAYEITKGLTFKTELGLDKTLKSEDRFFGPSTYFSRDGAATIYTADGSKSLKGLPIITMRDDNTELVRNTNTLTFEKKNINKKQHNFSAVLGNEIIMEKSKYLYNEVQGLPLSFTSDVAFAFSSEGTPISTKNYINPEDRLVSFFGRANYDYKGRYIFTATMRADGSSKFAAGNQWGFFPSGAFAWRISDESFMQETQEWLSNLKLRLSYGLSGNNQIESGQMTTTYSPTTTTYIPSLGTTIWTVGTHLANANLKWETTITRNIGLDFGVFKNKLNGNIELYSNTTKDLLIDFQTPGTGYASQYQNIGSTSNKGIEASINAVIIDKRNVGLDFNFNIGSNIGRVESLGGLEYISTNSGWTSDIVDDYRVYVGQPIGLMYGYETLGRYTVDDFTWDGTQNKWIVKNGVVVNAALAGDSWGPGALKLKDQLTVDTNADGIFDQGDGIINDKDRVIIGSAAPLFTGGFSLSARVYSFDVSANFNFVYGNDVYNANKIEFTTTNKYRLRNMTSEMATGSRWTNINANGVRVTDEINPETGKYVLDELNANTTLWSPFISRYIIHSWAVEDGSFLRLGNLTIGYSLPKKLLSKIKIQQLRIYATGINLLCLTNYTGYDPEVNTRRKSPLTPNVDYSAYPKNTSFNFGVNLTF